MAKFRGDVGFANIEETSPGVFEEIITKRTYRGDLLRESNRWQEKERVIDDLVVENRVSIVGDSFAQDHIGAMRFVEFGGSRWKISSVEIERPRIILSLSGVYNGPTS